MSIRLDFPTAPDGTGLPAATNAQVVALSSNAVAVTPASLVDAGVINWFFDTPIKASADGLTTAKFASGALRFDSPEGTSWFGVTELQLGIEFAGITDQWIGLRAGNSPGFTVQGAMQWGSSPDLMTLDQFGVALGDPAESFYHTFGANGLTVGNGPSTEYALLNQYGLSQVGALGTYGSMRLAGTGVGLLFSNDGNPVPITTDGGPVSITALTGTAFLYTVGTLGELNVSGSYGTAFGAQSDLSGMKIRFFDAAPAPQAALNYLDGGADLTACISAHNQLLNSLNTYGLVLVT